MDIYAEIHFIYSFLLFIFYYNYIYGREDTA